MVGINHSCCGKFVWKYRHLGFRGNEYMKIQRCVVVNMDIRGSEYRKFNFLEKLDGKVGKLFRQYEIKDSAFVYYSASLQLYYPLNKW